MPHAIAHSNAVSIRDALDHELLLKHYNFVPSVLSSAMDIELDGAAFNKRVDKIFSVWEVSRS